MAIKKLTRKQMQSQVAKLRREGFACLDEIRNNPQGNGFATAEEMISSVMSVYFETASAIQRRLDHPSFYK